MRISFVLLSALMSLTPAAIPQTSNSGRLPEPGVNQGATNPAMIDALKQLAGNGFVQDSAQSVQPARPPLPRPPQVAPWTGPFANIGPYGNGLDLGLQRQELVGSLPNSPKPCAIPLLEVPVDGDIDKGIKGIRIPYRLYPKMAVPPPAPACESQPATQPKPKAK